MKRFAVLASGYGSNLQAIIKACKDKQIHGHLALVFSNKPDAYALVRAKKAGIPTATLSQKDFANREDFDRAVLSILKAYRIDYIVLAGYMRLLSPVFVKTYANKMINIHPALLPSFKGTHGIEDAFKAGVKVVGPTVHFVVDEMDAGAIIAQEAVKVLPKDTLETLTAKIHKAEHRIYPKAIDLLVRGKLKLLGGRVTGC